MAAAAGAAIVAARWARIVDLVQTGGLGDRLTACAAIALPLAALASLLPPVAERIQATLAPVGRTLSRPEARVGGALAAGLALALLFAPILAPADPTVIDDAAGQRAPSSWAHPMGTDSEGRDMLSRVLHGGRTSLLVALAATAISVAVGTSVGVVAAWARPLDGWLMRLVDVGLAFPRVFLLLALFAFWGRVQVATMVLILGLTGWFQTSRLVRAESLSVRRRDYMAAAVALGIGRWRALGRHLLPNVAAPVIVTAALGIGNVVLIESGLAYLGVGVQEPNPSWGRMINAAREYMLTDPRLAVFPGLAIAVTVLAFSLLGEGLRAALNPRGE